MKSIYNRLCWPAIVICFFFFSTSAQKVPVASGIDLFLQEGNFRQAIDSCLLLIRADSLNPDAYYKMGIASQNLMKEDQALLCFQRAAALAPDNKVYQFSLAKAFFNAGKNKLAEPVFSRLCRQDSGNWAFAWPLAAIYLQSERYDDALSIYDSFWKKDTTDYICCDKTAYAFLKKGDYPAAIQWYCKSLEINPSNLTAIKNLSYLYTSVDQADTAIALLTKGIVTDSTDMDLYIRRAQINFSKSYTKKALDDYLVLLAAGDSSTLFLKRAGIGYCYNLQPREAIPFLLKAYQADSADYETCSYLGQCFYIVKDQIKSIYYYNRALKILSSVNAKLAMTYSLLGDSRKEKKEYKEAINNYLKAYAINGDANLSMVVANIYDEKLRNREKAIFYYQRFLDTEKMARMKLPPDYIMQVKKRLEYLKKTKTNI